LLPASDLTAGGCFDLSLLRFCCGRSAIVSGRSTNAKGVTTREVQQMLHWVLVHLYSRLAQNPGASANYNSKKKVKEKGVEGLSLEKRTRLTKFPSHKMRESFTMQNHNIFFEQRAGCQRCQPLLKKLGAYLSQVLMKDNTFSFV
jgi:hypothetical protein